MIWDRIRASYDTVAHTYDDRFRDELRDKPLDRELLSAFAAAAGDPVVEVGCGPGHVGDFVRVRARHVVGIDLSREMAKLAAGRLDSAVVADMRSLPIATGALGGLLAFYSLIHVRRGEVGGVLDEFRRVLRSAGRVLLSAHEGDGEVALDEFLGQPVPFAATLFQLEELTGACRAAGLDVVRAERRTPYASESTVRLYVEAERPSADG